ncbi:MAG: hypothetical protein R3E42_13105 [Burkholderiaceae bacterium]
MATPNRRLELVVKDDQGKPDEGSKAKELMGEGVVATIGFCNTATP